MRDAASHPEPTALCPSCAAPLACNRLTTTSCARCTAIHVRDGRVGTPRSRDEWQPAGVFEHLCSHGRSISGCISAAWRSAPCSHVALDRLVVEPVEIQCRRCGSSGSQDASLISSIFASRSLATSRSSRGACLVMKGSAGRGTHGATRRQTTERLPQAKPPGLKAQRQPGAGLGAPASPGQVQSLSISPPHPAPHAVHPCGSMVSWSRQHASGTAGYHRGLSVQLHPQPVHAPPHCVSHAAHR